MSSPSLSISRWRLLFKEHSEAIASMGGVYISFYVKNIPSGPVIVIVSSGLLILALLFSPSQGILTQRFRVSSWEIVLTCY